MKKCLSGAVICLPAFLGLSLWLGGGPQDVPWRAPLNPQFVQYLGDLRNGPPDMVSADGHGLGYVPPPVVLQPGAAAPGAASAAAYPATYDLRTLGKLSAVRDQKSCGSCWTFGSLASLESWLLPAEARDFSEQDINLNHGFDYAACAGGNSYMAAAYLARWSGPLNETDVPYPYTAAATAFAPQKHVQQVIWLSPRTSSADNDNIKSFLTNYGAVTFAFYWNSPNYNATTASYYYPSSHSSNHEVAIVGWDDNYAAANFSPAAPGNGAFLVRNSWGTSWGQSGYFYISYYDATITELTSFNNAEPTSNYSGAYSYDPLGWVTSWGYGVSQAWGANIFSATSSESIAAVGFVTTDKNTQYVVNVYTGVTAGDPVSGTLAASKSGTTANPGYYTLALDSPVAVTGGSKFSVVIKFQNATIRYPVATEDKMSGYSSAAASNAGESFISSSGASGSWYDLYDTGSNSNCCIKAFRQAASAPIAHPHAVGDFDGDGADEAAVDFGTNGAWLWNAGAWTQLTAGNPENMVAFNADGDSARELAVDLGTQGLWVWNGGAWSQLGVGNPDYLVAADTNHNGLDELIVDFGPAGLSWRQDSGTFSVISGVDAQDLVVLDVDGNGTQELAADFGATGLWLWSGGSWTMLSSADARTLAALDAAGLGSKSLAAGFGGVGIWLWTSGVWTQLSGVNADGLIPGRMVPGGGEELAGDYGSVGLWLWAGGAWTQLSGVNADAVIAADTNADAADEIVGDFGTVGLWLLAGGSWSQLSGVNPEAVLAADIDGEGAGELFVDFGSLGVWLWNAGSWGQISGANPD